MNEQTKLISSGRAVFKQLVRTLDEQYGPLCAAHHLKPSYVDILFLLLQGGGLTPAEVSEAAGLYPNICKIYLRDLEVSGWAIESGGRVMAGGRAEAFREDIVKTVLDAEAWVSAHLPEVFGKAGQL